MGKSAVDTRWQDLEQQAYHAYREWPIWLLLRERELSARLESRAAKSSTPVAESNRARPAAPARAVKGKEDEPAPG